MNAIPNLRNYSSRVEINENFIGCSIDNLYIPLYAMYKSMQSIHIKDRNGEMNLIYAMPKHGGNYGRKRWIDFRHYYDSTYLTPCGWVNKQNTYFVGKGLVTTDSYKILLSVGLKTRAIKTFNPNIPRNNDLVLLISKDLDLPHHSLLNNKLKKELIIPGEIDVIKTDSIEKFYFNLPNFIPKLNSFKELKEHLQGISKIAIDEKQDTKGEEENTYQHPF